METDTLGICALNKYHYYKVFLVGRIVILLSLGLFFITCSNKDNGGGEGYLTSIENVKSGIIGVWKTTKGIYYYGYFNNGKRCNGFSPEELTESCSKYEIIKDGSKFIMRGYGSGDLEGTGNYLESEIFLLNEYELTIGSISYTRVK